MRETGHVLLCTAAWSATECILSAITLLLFRCPAVPLWYFHPEVTDKTYTSLCSCEFPFFLRQFEFSVNFFSQLCLWGSFYALCGRVPRLPGEMLCSWPAIRKNSDFCLKDILYMDRVLLSLHCREHRPGSEIFLPSSTLVQQSGSV